MKKAILGKKVGMTQMFLADGTMIPVTVVEAGPCPVVQKKTVQHDGYNAIQVGFAEIRERLVSKPRKGHFEKAGVKVMRYLRELKLDDAASYEIGSVISADLFEVGEHVDVTGTSKGKGWAGTIKRHNFMRHRKTHGGKGNTRKVGSIGSMYPQKVLKGKRMAGQMGHKQVTVKNLTVAYIDNDKNLIGVKGAVPGPRKGIVTINGKETK